MVLSLSISRIFEVLIDDIIPLLTGFDISDVHLTEINSISQVWVVENLTENGSLLYEYVTVGGSHLMAL